MRFGILIVFSYENELPGAVQDIYHAATYMKKICDQIIIYTDVKEDEDIRVMSLNFNRGLVRSDAIQVIHKLRKENLIRLVTDGRELLNSLLEILHKGIENLFFYYSGHSSKGYFITPNHQKTNFTILLDIFMKKLPITTKIFIVLDACYINGMNLRYQLDDRGQYMFLENRLKLHHKIICVSSTSNSQESLSSSYGSVFTREFFGHLSGNNRNLGKLVAEVSGACQISNPQEVNVHASFPDLTYLWGWIYGSPVEIEGGSVLVVKMSKRHQMTVQ